MSTDRPRSWILPLGLGLCALGLTVDSRGQGGAPGTQTGQTPTEALPYVPAYGTADSNGRMIAVTGVDITGASILYVIDSESRRLSVYQALGGSETTAGVRWLGARNIDLDLKVNGWKDNSSISFTQLEEEFNKLKGEPPSGR